MSTHPARWIVLIAASLLWSASARAQWPVPVPTQQLVSAGSEWERYLRVLQLTGDVALLPWGVRAFGPTHLARLAPRDSQHLWHDHRLLDVGSSSPVAIIAPDARLTYNTAFPFGYNDGAVWAGRGATVAATAGVAGRAGPLSVVIAPVAFAARNAPFALRANGRTGEQAFADGYYPGVIDRPQRFGDSRYVQVDWGASTVRMDVAGVAAGISTANEYWGPAVEHPVLFGNNAAGFPHVFVGTSRPVDLWIGTLHGRVLWGRLEQSAYSPAPDSFATRLGTGLVATFTPRGVPGLELGGGRFFHMPWPGGGFASEHLWKPFEGILKQSLATEDNPSGDQPQDNQLASVFARWAFPASGFEVYAEYGREDHSWDARDLWMEIDHISAYGLGMQKVWKRQDGLLVGRAELLNTRISHLQQVRGQSPMYVHGRMRQGHTHRGQVLGSAGGPGGGAATVAADYLTARGRWTVSWTRLMQAERRGPGGLPVAADADVLHALGVEALVFRRGVDLIGGVRAVQNYNRNGSDDAFNLNVSIGARANLP